MDMRRLRELAGMDQELDSTGAEFSGGPNVGDENDVGGNFEEIIEQVKQDLQPLFESEEGCDLLADLVEFIESGMCEDDELESDQDADSLPPPSLGKRAPVSGTPGDI